MKKAISEKDYIIEDLVLERDQISDDRYAQRIKYETTLDQLTKANGIIKNEHACPKKDVGEGKELPEKPTEKLGVLQKKYDTK